MQHYTYYIYSHYIIGYYPEEMAKDQKKKNSQNSQVAALKTQLERMSNKVNELEKLEIQVDELEKKNKSLEDKVEILESRVNISENTSKHLTVELDRLDQYHRRSNVMLKNVFLPEDDNDYVFQTVKNTLTKDLGLSNNIVNEIDKFHRVGKIKDRHGKKTQDIIIRFKSHHARYSVIKERKKAKNMKVSPNLTKRRASLLYDASQVLENIEGVNFPFANIHGDLNIRLVAPYNGNHVYPFHLTPWKN